MPKWGLVCIGPAYAHAGMGGDRATFGASPENLKRAAICLDILGKQPYVDAKRIAAYGNSMGATIGLAASDTRLKAPAIYEGVGHNPHQEPADVYAKIKAWLEKHKVLTN